MKFITVKSKQTTASVDLVPPLVLGDKQRISLVDIRIPEQYFEFTDDQAIGDENRFKKKLKIIKLSKHLGKYNARRLQQVLNGDSLKAELGLEITITDKAAYLTTQSKEIIVSSELTKNFNIPRESKPYSAVKISGDEKYFVYCDLVEENNSIMSGENNAARIMPSKLLAVAPKSESGVYPELKLWEVFCEDGKEYKKEIWDEESLLGKYIEGEVAFSIANIFVGKSQSIICVAKEILVKEVMNEKSYFQKYPVWRRR